MTKLRSAFAAGVLLAVAMVGIAGTAEAKSKFRFHGFHKFHHDHIYFGHGCGFYKRMWWRTGARFWKRKYYRCIYY